ncbi:MAG TPA: DNA polymerase ligase N-terminal domain-containing protein, partial [Candidatus Binatia bacterium]|nr:DNA polymerase ligase N-terminal domain-containing protein [Candidatus Binatia bacterium]
MGYFQRVEATSPLSRYRQKRDPERTPEPFAAGTAAPGCRFVIQKHSARRLHYDLRLEMDGVLKSWAVPRGPSVDPDEKRLALQVEDHPIDYANFEGVIPRGNYGAGPVIVWDRGRYRWAKAGDPLEQLKSGHLEIEFYGYKMRGLWTLIRLPKEETTWLLMKKADGFAGSAEITESYPRSVLSGLALEEIADVPGKLSEMTQRLRRLEAPAQSFSASDQPLMLASLQAQAFSAPEWLFEIKYDGVRVLAERNGDQVELYGRNQTVISNRYPELTDALKHLPFERFIIDGEIVALDEMGRSNFQKLQARMHLTRARDIEAVALNIPVQAIFFDCLAFAGHDLRGLPLL